MKLIVIGILFAISCGCAKVRYTSVAGEEFKYSRFGKQKIDGFGIELRPDGTKVISMKGQEGSGGNVLVTIDKLVDKIP